MILPANPPFPKTKRKSQLKKAQTMRKIKDIATPAATTRPRTTTLSQAVLLLFSLIISIFVVARFISPLLLFIFHSRVSPNQNKRGEKEKKGLAVDIFMMLEESWGGEVWRWEEWGGAREESSSVG